MPREVEFLDDADGADPGDEALAHPGPPHPARRWAAGIAAAVVVVVVLLVVAGRHRHGSPAPISSDTHRAAPTPRPSASAERGSVRLAFGHVQAVAGTPSGLIALEPGYFARIGTVGDSGLRVLGRSDVGLPIGDPAYAQWNLSTDGLDLWVAASGPSDRVYTVNADTLHVTALAQPPGPVGGAAPLDGVLYVDTASGIYREAATARGVARRVVPRGADLMVADPQRHRLLLLDGAGAASRLRAYTPSTGAVVALGRLPFAGSGLVVAGTAIWLAGHTRSGQPVLARLDPTTLRIVASSPVTGSLRSTPLVTAGHTDLWVRSAATGSQLWCVDARTGHVAAHWQDLPGTISALATSSVVTRGSVVTRLHLPTACPG